MPSSSETSEAVRNQASALRPIRPIASPLPILAMPTTSVVKTSGAMIIFTRRRKMSEKMEM